MPLRDIARLARVVRVPLVLASTDGEILLANPAARQLSAELAEGHSLARALSDPDADVASDLRRWSRHGSPVPARLRLRGPVGPVECRADVARVEVSGSPAVLLAFRAEEPGDFARLNDQLERLRQEVRYRRVVEQERASALEAEQVARGRLERLQALTAALASALTIDDVVEAILRYGPDAVGADGVVVRLVGSHATERLSDGVLEPVAGLLAEGEAPDDPDRASGPLQAALAPGGEFYADRTELEARYPDACAIREGQPYLAGAVPLRASGDGVALGVLGIVCGHGRSLPADGRVTAGIVASLCAQALERARLHDQERRFAETLQYALLPERLPQVPGVDVAVRYMPASETVAVGGDWYDVIALEGERLGLVVGDVAGHGPTAATAMAQVRNALRALATTASTPADAIASLNSYLCGQLPEEMATVVFVVVDRGAGLVRYANAGHLPPLLLSGELPPVYLRGGLGPPVGVEPGARYGNTTVELPVGSRIVIYTDGLVERRDESIDLGLRRLERAVRPAPGGVPDAGELCEEVVRKLVGASDLSDDAVVVVADMVGSGGEDGVEVDPGDRLEVEVGVADAACGPDADRAHAGG